MKCLAHGSVDLLLTAMLILCATAYEDQYVAGTDHDLLKWKYAHMNSVDFELKWALLPALKRLRKTSGQDVEEEGAGALAAKGEDEELELPEREGWGLFLIDTKGTRGTSDKRVLLQVRTCSQGRCLVFI